MSYTLIIIIFTALVSFSAFDNHSIKDKMLMWPTRVWHHKELYRLVSHGFIHADITHLLFNMLTLYFFGSNIETITAGLGGKYLYFVLYLSAIAVAALPSLSRHKNDNYYRSLGASGGVAAVLFAAIYYNPWSGIGLLILPGLDIPAILFAVLYLALSVYLSKRGTDNIAHDAHFFGAVYGFAFAWAIDPTHGQFFIEQMSHPQFGH